LQIKRGNTQEARLSQRTQEIVEMERIQHWFDQIMGIAQIEQQQRDRAREIFCATPLSLARLETPACWRRIARVSGLKR
jgi:hypothetical protein